MITDEQALANKIRVQSEGTQAWISNNRRGTLAWATGVGKSKGSILCIESIRQEFPDGKILLVVPTEEMRDTDWPAEFQKWNCSLENIKLVCYSSLAAQDLSKYVFIIYDECHRLTTGNLQKLYHYKGAALGLTATYPKVKFEDEEERVSLITELLPPVHTITTDEAVDLGLIADFEVFVLKFYLDAVNRNILGGTKKKPFKTTEKNEYTRLTKSLQFAMIKKNEGMKFGAIAKRMNFMYNLPSKVRLAKQCMDSLALDGKRTLILCGSIEQANELCGDNVFHSKSSGDALDKFQALEIDVLAAVRALNEGKNLNSLEQELIIQIDSQERNLAQRIGRAVRKWYGKPDFKAKIIILVAANTVDEKWYKSAILNFESKRIKEYIVRVPDMNKSVPVVVA